MITRDAGDTMGTTRYLVSTNLPPSKRREGFRAEIVDVRHPPTADDPTGGPTAIEWYATEAQAYARLAAITKAEGV